MNFPKTIGLIAATVAILLLPQAANAASGGAASEVIFLAQIMLLIFVGRLMGEAMQRIGQPAVTGQLLAGIFLGPTVFGFLFPETRAWLFPAVPEQKAMLDAISQVGILMLLLLTGMETDLRLVRRAGRAAASVSVAGIIVPFVCGFTLGEFLPDWMLPRPDLRIITSLFLGTALSIASIKIVAMVVREMNFMRRNLGQVIVSSAIIDDSIGWIIIAVIFGLAEHGSVDLFSVSRSVLGTLFFLFISLTLGRRVVAFIIRWTNDNFISEMPVISAILLIMGGMALITNAIGVHTVLGAFVAGVLIGESPILTRHIDEQLRGLITAFFAPVFFGVAGLGTDLTILSNPFLLGMTILLILIASVGKFGGAFAGGRIGGLTGRESFALALGMNARGSTEVIIATIGLSLGALSQDLFSMIVAMAIVTTMIMPPTLRWALLRIPLRKEEEERLEREAFAERGFVTNLERLLLAVDESNNGKFALRLGGLLAGSVGMPATILHMKDEGDDEAAPSTDEKAEDEASSATEEEAAGSTDPDDVAAAGDPEEKKDDEDETRRERQAVLEDAQARLKAAAETTKPIEGGDEAKAAPTVDVTAKLQELPATEAIASEAKKGYDFLLAGLSPAADDDGNFDNHISKISAGFEGPLGILVARGKHAKRPLQSRYKILVPVTGTGVSRRGAEVALALAHASSAPVTALYISDTPRGQRARPFGTLTSTPDPDEAVLKDIAEMADNYSTPMATAVRRSESPAGAILREIKRGGYDFVVMGVSRRPGEQLYLGSTAAAMLKRGDFSLLFVASETYGQERRPTEKQETAK